MELPAGGGLNYPQRAQVPEATLLRARDRPGDGIAFGLAVFRPSPSDGWAADHILARAVVLNKVEIGGGDGNERDAEVADDGDRLEKNFGKNDSGTPVQIDTAVMHALDEGAEKAEIVMGGSAESSAVNGRMHVGDIRADGKVNGNRDFLRVSGDEHAHFRMPGLEHAAREVLPRGFAVAHADTMSELGDFV